MVQNQGQLDACMTCTDSPTSPLPPVPSKLGWVTHSFFTPVFILLPFCPCSQGLPSHNHLVFHLILSSVPPAAFSQLLLQGLRDDTGSGQLQRHTQLWTGGIGGNDSHGPDSQKHHRAGVYEMPKDRGLEDSFCWRAPQTKGSEVRDRVKINTGVLRRARIRSEASDILTDVCESISKPESNLLWEGEMLQ